MTPIIRPATDADADAIARIEEAAARSPWPLEAVRSRLAMPSTVACVAGEPVIGHVLSSCVADEGEILTLAVLPQARRRGVATALLRACAAAWAARDATTGWLEVRDDNQAARALYLREGWMDAGVRERYYADGTDAVVMRWEAAS